MRVTENILKGHLDDIRYNIEKSENNEGIEDHWQNTVFYHSDMRLDA